MVPLLPWFLAGFAAGLFTAWVERRYIGAEGSAFTLSFLERCLLAGRVVWFYLGKLFWPEYLIFIYPRWQVSAGIAWQYLFPLGVVALLAILWRWRGRFRGALAGFFFIGSLVPALGFVNVYPFVYSFVADHFQYLASLGIMFRLQGGMRQVVARAGDDRKEALAGAAPHFFFVRRTKKKEIRTSRGGGPLPAGEAAFFGGAQRSSASSAV